MTTVEIEAGRGPLFTTAQAAEYLSLQPQTVREMFATGKVVAFRTQGEHGDWRVSRSSLDRWIECQESSRVAELGGLA